MELNTQQQAAVDHIEGPLLVLAGAGTGKTRVITRKVVALASRHEVPATTIFAVTFTNKAAREMRERISVDMGAQAAAECRISTFHRLGLDILRREYASAGYRRNFSVLDAADSRALLKEVLTGPAEATDAAVESCRSAISGWKNDLVAPQEALSRASDDLELAQARQYMAYQQALRCYNAMDFDDLLLLPVRVLQEDDQARLRWQGRTGYLLVDEYQDTNFAQYQLMRMLTGDSGRLTVVGDDDQSIYAWRGARPENLKTLAADFPGLRVIKLEQNYRCAGRILAAANALIANNSHVFEKRLWSDLGSGDRIRVMRARDARDEADRVAMEIQRLAIGRGTRWGDIGVLYRGNHQARPLEQALRSRGIPCRVTGGPSFFERPEIRDLLAYLRLVANPEDDAAFLRVVNVPRREIGPATVGRLADYASSRGQPLIEASLEAGLHGVLSDPAVGRLQQFARGICQWHAGAGGDRPADELAKELIEEIGYRQWLRDACRDRRHEETCLENVDEFLDWLRRLSRSLDGGGLAEVLSRLALMDMLDRQEGDAAGEAVSLMTLHAAKGLEFSHVLLVGFEEDMLPHRSSVEAETVEEERRLAYVGMTRAMRGLVITYCERRTRFGEAEQCAPSRFLAEMPEELLDWEGREAERSQEERRERGRAAIADLRQLLVDT